MSIYLYIASVMVLWSIVDYSSAKTIDMNLMRRNKIQSFTADGFTQRHIPIGYEHDQIAEAWLYGSINTTFEFYTGIEIGGQLFTVQVDTGSCTLAVPAVGCTQYTMSGRDTGVTCPHADAFLDVNSGDYISCSTYPVCYCSQKTSDCLVELGYGDGSFLVGPMVQDTVSVAGISAEVYFGAITAESKDFARFDVDGIMGIAYTGLYPEAGDSVFDKLVSSGQINDSFAMCLGPSGGIWTLGGVNPAYSAGPMTFTPIIEESYYVVQLTDFLVGSTSIGVSQGDLNGNHSIVDSGTTLLVLNEAAFDAMVTTFQNVYCPQFPKKLQQLCQTNSQGQSIFSPGLCWSLSHSDIMNFPTLTVQLEGAKPLTIGPDQYFLSIQGGYCFGIAGSSGLGTILGDVFMQAFNVFFDRANKRIGFAPVQNCQGSASISIVGGDKQTANVGSSYSDALTVNVTFADGSPAVGIIVEFNTTEGSATFHNYRAATDSTGMAQTTVTPKSGGTIKVVATVKGTDQTVTFTLQAKYLPIGAIIGITIGALAFVGVVVAIIVFIRRRRHHHNQMVRYTSLAVEEEHR